MLVLIYNPGSDSGLVAIALDYHNGIRGIAGLIPAHSISFDFIHQ